MINMTPRRSIAALCMAMMLSGCVISTDDRSSEERTLDKRISRREAAGQDTSGLKRARGESEIRRSLQE